MKLSFEDIFLTPLLKRQDSDKLAFCVRDVNYSYSQLFDYVEQIFDEITNIPEDLVFIYSSDNIRTYAAIIALWYAGKGYVVLNPVQPKGRHQEIIESVGGHYIISSVDKYDAEVEGMIYIKTSRFTHSEYKRKYSIVVENYSPLNTVYMIFTSGSTGKPKGVQINRRNLSAFLLSFDNIGLDITENDRCLQPFDLSFDASIESYVYPLFKGASIYTIPEKKTKYLYIAYLLDEYHLTFLHIVPSMVRNLIPYLDEVYRKSIRYNLFGGEALTTGILKEWHKDCPEMITYNIYGPTENTDICSCYVINNDTIENALVHNDVISIGKTFGYTKSLLIDCENKIVSEMGIEGELCLGGEQLTTGYWNIKDNIDRFINIEGERYYKTGDICYYGKDFNLMFVNRKDYQVKINGYRVEIGEIENKYYDISKGKYSVVLPYNDDNGNINLAIIIEGEAYDYKEDKAAMTKILPLYEVPAKWLFVKSFPLNTSGKIDRNKIKEIFNL